MTPAITPKQVDSPSNTTVHIHQKAFEHALNPIAVLDKSFNFISVNHLYAQADNKNSADFPGHNHFEFYPNADNEAIFQEVVKIKKPYFVRAKPFKYAYNPDRGITFWDWSLVPVLDDRNEVEFLILSLINVTEHILENIKLEELTEKLRKEINERKKLGAIVESSNDPIITMTLEGKITSWNLAAERLYGYKAQEVIGTHISRLIPEGFSYEQHILERIGRGEFVRSYETIRKSKFGQIIHVSLTFSPLRDESGKVLGISTIVRDITQRIRMEEKLKLEISQRKQSEAYLKAIFDNSKLGIIISDLNGKVLKCNAALANMLGYSQEELSNISCSTLIHQDDLFIDRDKEIEIYHGQCNYYETEKRYLKKDGGILWINLTTVSAESANARIVISFFHDITEKKQFQEQMLKLDRLHLVGEMAAGISHEVRNPMTTVRGFLQVLREKKVFNNYKDYFDLMIEELDRANIIITEFLSIGHNAKINLQKENLNDIIGSIKPLIEASAYEQDKYLEVELTELPDLLLNHKEIRQVILNLCKNGLEAMLPGQTLKIKTFCRERQVILAVQDEGEGIKPELIKKLGTPFITTKERGTGLGLGVCYGIAARHNADISFDTGPKGTTFFVKFNILNQR